jgi:hypothetical protein
MHVQCEVAMRLADDCDSGHGRRGFAVDHAATAGQTRIDGLAIFTHTNPVTEADALRRLGPIVYRGYRWHFYSFASIGTPGAILEAWIDSAVLTLATFFSAVRVSVMKLWKLERSFATTFKRKSTSPDSM